jgi:hypothetical protein
MRVLILKLTSLCVVIFACALVCPAQNNQKTNASKAKPDLSGTWLLEWDKGSVGKSSSTIEVKLKIVHSEPEIKIHRMINRNGQSTPLDFTYFTDGRGESNQTTMYVTTNPGSKNLPDRPEYTKSQTRWSGGKVVTRSLVRNILGGRVIEHEVVDEWKLSGDGKTLTQTTRWIYQPDPFGKSIYVPSGAPDTKRVYIRISD